MKKRIKYAFIAGGIASFVGGLIAVVPNVQEENAKGTIISVLFIVGGLVLLARAYAD